jgi:hypothetical protein
MIPVIYCDRCGAMMNSYWVRHDAKAPLQFGGNCTGCGDDLCAECAGSFSDDGECEACASKGEPS